MKFISLFAGIGGFDLGFERAGMTCAAQVENNPHATAVLEKHFPNALRFEDVCHVGRHNLPAVDVICGGFPCQDVSVAGRRAGLAGERSGLWFEFLRILTELKPRWCVIENVPGLLSSNRGRDFAVVLCGLVECGYSVAYRVLDAQHFGVAQRRRRVFIVGSLGTGRSAEVLFERESGAGHSAESRKTRPELATDIAASLRSSGEKTGTRIDFEVGLATFRMQRSDSYESTEVASTLAARDFKSATDLVAFNMTFCDSNGRRKDRPNGGLYVNETQQANTLHTGNPAERTVIAFNWNAGAKAGLSNGALEPTLRAGHHNHPAVAIDVRNLRSNGDVSGTLQSKATGGYSLNYTNPVASMFGVRRLTPRECERLQGFPDDWTTGLSDSARYARLGNAVCVNVAEWLGKRIVAVSS